MTRATYSAKPLLRSLVLRPQGVILVRISEDVFEKSAFYFGDSAHRIRRMKVPFRRSAALRQTVQIRHSAKRIRQCSLFIQFRQQILSVVRIKLERIQCGCITPIFYNIWKNERQLINVETRQNRESAKNDW